jgi:hypothetical protein
VKLSITRGGGLAGVPIQTELVSDELPPDAAQELEAHAKAVVPAAAPRSRSPDEMLYTVRIEADDGVREAHYTDSTLPEEVRSLIAWTDQRPEKREEIGPPR